MRFRPRPVNLQSSNTHGTISALVAIVALLASAVVALSAPDAASAATSCGKKVLADWFDNGRIDRLYRYFERLGDRAGQHHAEVFALTGRNRARWSGKKEEAEVFMNWLVNH